MTLSSNLFIIIIILHTKRERKERYLYLLCKFSNEKFISVLFSKFFQQFFSFLLLYGYYRFISVHFIWPCMCVCVCIFYFLLNTIFLFSFQLINEHIPYVFVSLFTLLTLITFYFANGRTVILFNGNLISQSLHILVDLSSIKIYYSIDNFVNYYSI